MSSKIILGKKQSAPNIVIDSITKAVRNLGPEQGLVDKGSMQSLFLTDQPPVTVTADEANTSCWLMDDTANYTLKLDGKYLPVSAKPMDLITAVYNDEYFSSRIRMGQCGLFNGTAIADEAGGWAFIGFDASKQVPVEIMLRDMSTMEEVGIRVNFNGGDNFRAILDAINFNQQVASFFYRNSIRVFQHIPFEVSASVGELVPLNITYQGDHEILIQVRLVEDGVLDEVVPYIFGKAKLRTKVPGTNSTDNAYFVKLKDDIRDIPPYTSYGGENLKLVSPIMVTGYVSGTISYVSYRYGENTRIYFHGYSETPIELFEFLRQQNYSEMGLLYVSDDATELRMFANDNAYQSIYDLDAVADTITGGVPVDENNEAIKINGKYIQLRIR